MNNYQGEQFLAVLVGMADSIMIANVGEPAAGTEIHHTVNLVHGNYGSCDYWSGIYWKDTGAESGVWFWNLCHCGKRSCQYHFAVLDSSGNGN